MSRTSLFSSVLVAALAIAGWTAPAIAAAGKAIPQFEVDKAWPQKPAGMKWGDVSSIAIDANDNAWVLSRPRTLKPEDKAQAAESAVVPSLRSSRRLPDLSRVPSAHFGANLVSARYGCHKIKVLRGIPAYSKLTK